MPATLEQLPDELLNGSASDAAFRRFDSKGLDASTRKYVVLEQKMTERHNEALEKARTLLRGGGSRKDAADILSQAFQENWKMLKESDALK